VRPATALLTCRHHIYCFAADAAFRCGFAIPLSTQHNCGRSQVMLSHLLNG